MLCWPEALARTELLDGVQPALVPLGPRRVLGGCAPDHGAALDVHQGVDVEVVLPPPPPRHLDDRVLHADRGPVLGEPRAHHRLAIRQANGHQYSLFHFLESPFT